MLSKSSLRWNQATLMQAEGRGLGRLPDQWGECAAAHRTPGGDHALLGPPLLVNPTPLPPNLLPQPAWPTTLQGQAREEQVEDKPRGSLAAHTPGEQDRAVGNRGHLPSPRSPVPAPSGPAGTLASTLCPGHGHPVPQKHTHNPFPVHKHADGDMCQR